jgi:hypothetical protein
MSYELVCEGMVLAGIILLVLTGLAVLAQFLESAGEQAIWSLPAPEDSRDESHRLGVSIAQSLIQNGMIDPGKGNEVARIVAWKLEMQKAFGQP